ncbi:hypothetical protein [Flavobacterium psychrotrophum]|uniref:hypothetical protein n=1 Tax=Flavobacterium psychrotrophum TaxID=2294119 RepID=UPI000E31F71A|nr:hypothetical protein [Flavobacterium psychrotrophum]
MENYSTKSSFDSFELQVTPVAQDFLRTAANWAMFLSILGFIGLGFGLLGCLTMFAAGSAMASGGVPFPATTFGVVGLAFTILGALPVVQLFRFSSRVKRAIAEVNTQLLTESFSSLKQHYMFVGIYVILGIIAYIALIGYFISMAASMGGRF